MVSEQSQIHFFSLCSYSGHSSVGPLDFSMTFFLLDTEPSVVRGWKGSSQSQQRLCLSLTNHYETLSDTPGYPAQGGPHHRWWAPLPVLRSERGFAHKFWKPSLPWVGRESLIGYPILSDFNTQGGNRLCALPPNEPTAIFSLSPLLPSHINSGGFNNLEHPVLQRSHSLPLWSHVHWLDKLLGLLLSPPSSTSWVMVHMGINVAACQQSELTKKDFNNLFSFLNTFWKSVLISSPIPTRGAESSAPTLGLQSTCRVFNIAKHYWPNCNTPYSPLHMIDSLDPTLPFQNLHLCL